MMYNDYIVTLSRKFASRLEGISADYNFDYGDEFEVAICEILRDFLPSKYGICRGYLVSACGDKEGDDIIIYDQEKFPTLKLNKKDDYSRKENIPIEAVYAYIEAKHNLTSETLFTALGQIKAIKKLCHTRKKVGVEQYDPYLTFQSDSSKYSMDYPSYRNPLFAMILSRKSKDDKGSTDASDIESMLRLTFDKATKKKKHPFLPDMIVAGNDVFAHIGYAHGKEGVKPTLFLNEDKDFSFFTKQTRNIAYGLGLANLFAALDWIRLGRMPWPAMLNEGLLNDSHEDD